MGISAPSLNPGTTMCAHPSKPARALACDTNMPVTPNPMLARVWQTNQLLANTSDDQCHK